MYDSKSEKMHGVLFGFIAGILTWKFFGKKLMEKMEGKKAVWFRLKHEIFHKYYRTKDRSQETYDKIVDEVTDKYARLKNISQTEMEDIARDLKSHWMKIKDAWNDNNVKWEGDDIE